jgi:outer membrane protein assembly factor BamB
MNRDYIRLVAALLAASAMHFAGYTASAQTSSAKKAKAPPAVKATKATGKAPATKSAPAKTTAVTPDKQLNRKGDWNQWGGSPTRNNTPDAKNLPTEWEIGEFDSKTGEWQKDTAKNILWASRLGSQTYGNPVVANGKVYVGTNNGAGWLARYPADVDLGVLLCFDQKDGKFLWQHSSEKLPSGRVHDWPLQGICAAPLVEGERVWFVTSRGEVRCLDSQGFHDGENDGPYKDETNENKDEADVLWMLDMMKPPLNVSQHNMASCSLTSAGDLLFVNTSNGVDEGHFNLPSPNAPSFLAVDKNTGKVLWADNSPGPNVLHGQWSSPAYAVLGGVPQVIFGAGDGYMYSFLATAENDNGKPYLLWKFDCNPKESKYVLGGRADRNHIIGTPVIYNEKVYVAVGEDPEHGEGVGHLWCIDPNKRGDVSPELAFKVADLDKPNPEPIPHRRNQAVVKEEGEVARANPNSAAIWHYAQFDQDGDGEIAFEETMHRSIGSVAIQDDLLYIADFSGLFHCLDAKTGKPHWTYDMLAASWGSPLIADGKVYIGDEDGDVAIFNLSKEKHDPIAEINVGNSVYSTPIVSNNILYIANKTHIFAISEDADSAAKSEAE